MIEKSLDVNGFKIAYTEIGPADGRVVFCVHGLLSNGRDYDALGEALAQRGYRVIAMDLPGRGHSDWFDEAAKYLLPNYVPYCLALLAEVAPGRGFDWLGVSLGGMIGMALTGMDGLRMERLVLVDIGAEIPGSALDVVAGLAKAPTLYGNEGEAIAFLKKRCGVWGIREEATWAHLIRHNIRHDESGQARMHYDPKIGEALTEKNETLQFWPLWETIRQPVLLVRGGQSIILPPDIAEQMTAKYTGKDFQEIVFADCGHVPNLMEAGQVERVLAWF